jgi:hypothetical protein
MRVVKPHVLHSIQAGLLFGLSKQEELWTTKLEAAIFDKLSQKFDTKTGDRKRISGPTNKWNGELE